VTVGPNQAFARAALVVLVLALTGSTLGACGSRKRNTTGTGPAASAAKPGALPGIGKPQVTIGDKNFTEQFLLGQLYKQALLAQGFNVLLNPNIGSTEVTMQALQSGRLAMYPEYLQTWNATIAGDQRQFASAGAAYAAAQSYAVARGFRLLRPTPFSDTSAIGVTSGYAADNGLRSIGDLRGVQSALVVGAPPQFRQSPAGLPALERAYGLQPAMFKALDVGAQYQALDQGTIQAADVNTTDPQLSSGSYALLRDPRRVFGWGNAVPVVSAQVLSSEGPAFAQTIDRVSALLTTTTIRQLNAAVDLYHQQPSLVAKQFLQQHGLIPAQS